VKIKIWSWAVVSILCVGSAGLVRAEDDARVIGKIGQNGPKDHLRTASFYLDFKGNKVENMPALPAGEETRIYSKVWDGLYLQVTTETNDRDTTGYLFTFTKDEMDKEPAGLTESKDGPTLRELAASDFRSDDNFSTRPLKPGPGTPEDRGAFRVIHYDGFDVEIRVLEFVIGGAGLKKKPYFKTVSCLVTVIEKNQTGKE